MYKKIIMKTKKGDSLELLNPILSSRNTLDLTLENYPKISVKYEYDKNRCVALINNKSCILKLSEEDLNMLKNLFKKEFKDITDFYKKLINNQVTFLFYEHNNDGLITTEKFIEKGYPYINKLMEHYFVSIGLSYEIVLKRAFELKKNLKKINNQFGEHYEFKLHPKAKA